jgi:hypothetical protein
MSKYRGDVDDKLLELQEALQKLQVLKQIGASNLIIKQEKEIYDIQKDILSMNDSASIDAADAILPKKCRFCSEKTSDEEKIECYETNFEKCEQKEPMHIGLLSMSVLKLVISYIALLLLLFTFLLISNILFNFIDERWIVFSLTLFLVFGVIGLFYKPMKKLLQIVS